MSRAQDIGTLRLDIEQAKRRGGEVAPVSLSGRMLARILDERAMLLDALREMTFDNRTGGGAYGRACAAIAKADAP